MELFRFGFRVELQPKEDSFYSTEIYWRIFKYLGMPLSIPTEVKLSCSFIFLTFYMTPVSPAPLTKDVKHKP